MHLPGPLRAAVGLVASAAEEARHLPDRAIELPMLAVSTALQASLRAQQRYARLAARGDEVLNRRPPTDEPPAWATFDEPVSVAELRPASPQHQVEVERPAGKTAAARRTAAKKASPKRAPAKSAGKAVSKPRHTTPSRFDDAGD